MYQRSSDRDAARGASERRVGLFIDYESVRRGADDVPSAEGAELAPRLRELAHEMGRVLVACAYADWSGARAQAREFRRHHIEPRLVLGREGGDDRADLALALDALETLYLGPDLDVFVLVSGEGGLGELVQRLRRADKAVVLVGHDLGQGQAFRGADRFIPVDDLLGVRRPRRAPAAAPAPLAAAPPSPPTRRVDFSMFDWAPFIHLLDELEKNMPFVGFGWLLKKKLSPENSGCHTMQEKQELMDRAVEEGLLTLYKVDNIEEGGDPVTACKLNRENPRVAEFVGS